MNSTIWKQTDTRWAKKAYPSGSTVGGCGCGLLACTHVAMEQESKKNWTPNNLRAWMVSKGFAIRGRGTKWEGITETLKYIGHKNVVRVYDEDPMSMAWKELNKGNRIGILLFNDHKAPNGTKWSASGHYVAFTDYYVKNGKHYFYCKDSGGRNHSGIFSYENSMRGCLPKLWIVERVGKQTNGSATTKSATSVSATTYKPTTPYKGSLPTTVVKSGSKGASAKAVQQFLNWCINAKLTVDSIAGAKTVSAIKVYQKTYGLTVDGMFGSASKAKAQSIINAHKPKVVATAQDKACSYAKTLVDKGFKYVTYDTQKVCPICGGGKRYGSNCIGFVGICLKHGGGLPVKCTPSGLLNNAFADDLYKSSSKVAKWESRNGNKGHWQIIWNSGKSIPASSLKKGDILLCYNGSTYKHTALYYGDGKIADCNSDRGAAIRSYSALNNPCKIAVRWK